MPQPCMGVVLHGAAPKPKHTAGIWTAIAKSDTAWLVPPKPPHCTSVGSVGAGKSKKRSGQ